MKNIVITGSTRGIGFGLASSFLDLGCSVTICGRSVAAVDNAYQQLAQNHPKERILGQACDVTDADALQLLWDISVERFGKVDIWINNAGIRNERRYFWELEPEQIDSVVDTNLDGVLYGTRVAMRGMLKQGFGAIYQMEGLGSDGRQIEKLSLYGTTKHALHYFTQAMIRESRHTPIIVGSISPGMVVTDMLTLYSGDGGDDWERSRRVFNILADRVETVTPWIAERVLKNNRTGAQIRWLTTWKVLRRFILSPFKKRNVLDP